MRKSILGRLLAAAVAVAGLTAVGAAAAAPDSLNSAGAGYWTSSTLDTSLHVQALVGSAYAGEARRGQPLLDLCYVIGDDWGGREWSLVYNKATGVAGFIAQSELTGDKHRNFNCYGTKPEGPPFFWTTVTVPTSLHVQALVGSAYAGSVNPHANNLLDMCYVIGDPWGNPGSRYWDLVYNRDTGVAGFVSEEELDYKFQSFHCYPE